MVRQAHHKLKIYTKTGDKGETSLFGGKRVLKSDLRVEGYGSIDELNSLLGIIVSKDQRSKIKDQNQNSKLKAELIRIQQDLFEIGSLLAYPSFYSSSAVNASERSQEVDSGSLTRMTSSRQARTINNLKKRVIYFEKLIDGLTRKLPELKKFILPGGGEIGSTLHFARSVCRRAERRVVQLSKKQKVQPSSIIYLNRLSDLFFVMARFVNYKEGEKEILWEKK